MLRFNPRQWHHTDFSTNCSVGYLEMREQMCILTVYVLFQWEFLLLMAGVGADCINQSFIKLTKAVVLVSCAYDHRCLLTGLSESC